MSKPLKELLEDYRYQNEQGTPISGILTHEANAEMARRLRALNERHQKGYQQDDLLFYCVGCCSKWPCPDRRILNGR